MSCLLSWPAQSPVSSRCSPTSLLYCWASSPGMKVRLKSRISVVRNWRYDKLSRWQRDRIHSMKFQDLSHLPCVWFLRSVSVWCRRASGRGDSSSSRGPSPSGWPGRGWRPLVPSLGTHPGILLTSSGAWRHSTARLSDEKETISATFATHSKITAQFRIRTCNFQ